MDTIGGFWAGAVRFAHVAGRDDWIAALGGWEGACRATVHDLVEAGAPPDVARRWLGSPPLTTAARAIVRTSPQYPNALRTVKSAPPVLFVEGDLACLEQPAIAIVGTRRCSTYGAAAAHRIAYASAKRELCVVSGLARGIDTYAHRGALEALGRTIAVLGHGLGHTAPPSNVALRRRIVAERGLLLSTWPDEVPPARHTFPERNRWIAALSRRVVIVEAPEQSGALITAHQAMDLGRDEDLWVVPGPLGDRGWRGSAGLLSWGVRPLVDVESFLADLGGDRVMARHPDWLSALLCGATLDDCAQLRGISAVDLLQEVQLLELRGEVVRLPGGRYAATGGH
jgi:DNA processing protein